MEDELFTENNYESLMVDDYIDPYGNGTLVPSDHWGKGCPDDCDVHKKGPGNT